MSKNDGMLAVDVGTGNFLGGGGYHVISNLFPEPQNRNIISSSTLTKFEIVDLFIPS